MLDSTVLGRWLVAIQIPLAIRMAVVLSPRTDKRSAKSSELFTFRVLHKPIVLRQFTDYHSGRLLRTAQSIGRSCTDFST